jgi:hypothetical protein
VLLWQTKSPSAGPPHNRTGRSSSSRKGGIVTIAAAALGITPGALHKRIREHPELREVQSEAQEALLDASEALVINAIRNAGDLNTARWVLDHH